MEKVEVSLGERSYFIHIGRDLLSDPTLFTEVKDRQVVVISNDKIAGYYAQTLLKTLNEAGAKPALLVLPDGEKYKTLETFDQIMSFLLSKNYGRDVLLVALGGGVIGDLVGFAAATYQRGVEFIQIPTSLLAQVDSSVGGKTAVNHPMGKNMIGAFYQPKLVLIDINVLQTLPKNEFSAGMAEVIKYGIIWDAPFFQWLNDHLDLLFHLDVDSLVYVIKHCCQIKAYIVSQDEKEAGVRALLNLGHTFGHAIEKQMGYGEWLHGEAVAVGLILAAKTAVLMNLISDAQLAQITQLVEKANLPTRIPENMSYDHFIDLMARDKKKVAGKIRFVLPTSIGTAQVFDNVTSETLLQVINSSK